MNLELLTKQVANLSRAIGSYIRSEVNNLNPEDIEKKGVNDFVTYVDKTAEKRLVSELSRVLPEAGFLVEEETGHETKEKYNWIIDPLDGTTNFLHGVPIYSISIGLVQNGTLVSGVVLEINQNECFYAWKNGGAYLNGNPISVSKSKDLENSLIATGFPYTDFSRIDGYMKSFEHLLKSSRGMRRLGSAAADLAYVACGRFDAFYEYGLHPWDVAAGALLVQEAGGVVTDFEGEQNFLHGREIIACNAGVFNEFLSLIQSFFPDQSNS
jgi:myo-inositol-1(or 4)-monophosphatase